MWKHTMAASSSNDEELETENYGGILVSDHAPIDRIMDLDTQFTRSSEEAKSSEIDAPPAEVATEGEVLEEGDLRDAIERDLRRMLIEQAKIGAAQWGVGGHDGWEDVQDEWRGRDNLDGGKDEKELSEIVEDENWNDFGDTTKRTWVHNQNSKGINYPVRADAEDCAYYMKFGSCKYGFFCKFNHPPRIKSQYFKDRPKRIDGNSEKAGQVECKYYMAPGGCKNGNECRFSHVSDISTASQILELNFLGLPIRPGEIECPYYMRTGSCKYGLNCRFHHPDPTSGGGSPPGFSYGNTLTSQHVPSSSIASWSPPRDTSAMQPVTFHRAKGSTYSIQRHQAVTYPASDSGLPIPPAYSMNSLSAEINFPQQPRRIKVVEEYPERPGEPECSFFMKTGDCKFKFTCKFHHPKIQTSRPRTKPVTYALNDNGLPLRPGQPICTHYYRYGICKFGPACIYDHSAVGQPANIPKMEDGEKGNTS